MLRAATLRIALLGAIAGLAALPAAALAVPPSNDGYIQSVSVNAPNTPLTQDQVKDTRDTREATVQADLFTPPTAGGGAERTDCAGTQYGATVWYDFHPSANGTVRVQAAGFDAAISVYEFDPTSARIGARLDCSNVPGPTEELFVKVKKGKAYTIQIGGTDAGAGPATGDLDFTFEYLADTDGDGVLDALDKCPTQPGTSDGCPAVLTVLPTLTAVPTGGGIRIGSLSVAAPKGALVKVRCSRAGCAFNQTRTVPTSKPVRFARLRNRNLRAGARLEIFVTKKQSIGSYIRYVVTPGGFKRTVRCLRPGSLVPRTSCK
ncbi:MAG TPA: hypothetical protein VL120_02065 [Solirubrobacteraceae bacterium]|jgi:hypothetical protein|nr:hypothetical protein [Solirubrobacteraceae bacterium]